MLSIDKLAGVEFLAMTQNGDFAVKVTYKSGVSRRVELNAVDFNKVSEAIEVTGLSTDPKIITTSLWDMLVGEANRVKFWRTAGDGSFVNVLAKDSRRGSAAVLGQMERPRALAFHAWLKNNGWQARQTAGGNTVMSYAN